jgi:spore coat polysaccharide biosynthesis predicted glycosyltransferase SpsG
MKALMINCDYAFSASGQTVGELINCNIPFTLFCLDIDQIPLRDYYLENDIIDQKIDWNDKNFEEKINTSFGAQSSYNSRLIFINKASKLIDGKGVERIVNNIQKLL